MTGERNIAKETVTVMTQETVIVMAEDTMKIITEEIKIITVEETVTVITEETIITMDWKGRQSIFQGRESKNFVHISAIGCHILWIQSRNWVLCGLSVFMQ